MKRIPRFTPLEEAGKRALASLPAKTATLPLIQARWAELVGEYLARRLEAASFEKGCLALRLRDPSGRRTALSLLGEIERRLKAAFPAIRSVTLS